MTVFKAGVALSSVRRPLGDTVICSECVEAEGALRGRTRKLSAPGAGGAGVGSGEHEGGFGDAVGRRLEVQGGWFSLYLVDVECEDSLDLGDRQRMPVGGMSGRNQLLGTGEIEMGAFIGHDAV